MTAEISVMNKLAVAMAADSAVTIIGKKVYNTGSKLFPINHELPIGLMFYGNAQVITVPWETILAKFRESIANQKFKKVEDCGNAFIKFIQTSNDLFPQPLQEQIYFSFVESAYSLVVDSINNEVTNRLKSGATLKDEDIAAILDTAVNEEFLRWNNVEFAYGQNAQAAEGLKKTFTTSYEKSINTIFQNLPLSKDSKDKLIDLGAFYATKALLFNGLRSGFVFCGFGEEEIYPSQFSVELDLILNNTLRHLPPNIYSISNDNRSVIHPFAQQDVALTFLKGIDPNIVNLIGDYLKGFFTNLADVIDSANLTIAQGSQLDTLLQALKTNASNELIDKLQEVSNNNFVSPILSAVEMLSKDDLAHMAETLVNLTSFRRKMSLDLETVGGPIDVAVISKKDGFIWVKRKHYFSADLNPDFFKRNK